MKCVLRIFVFLQVFSISGCPSRGIEVLDRIGNPQNNLQLSVAETSPQQLSQDGQLLLRSFAESGDLPEMRWSNFSDYNEDVSRFYKSYGYSLPWVREMRPTHQANDLIALLQSADEKGLSADDYDGPQWYERSAKLRPATREPVEEDAIRFDVA